MNKFIAFFKDIDLLKRFLFLIFALVIFRIIASIPVPQVDTSTLLSLLSGNQLLGVLNIFSGGGLSNFSIGMLGVFPYITVSIVVQLLTVLVPKIHSMYHEEGEIGRKKIGQWTRICSVPVAALNAIGILFYFSSQGVFPSINLFDFITTVIIITAGSVLVMWIGELITEFGIGNGISFIVFAGIVVNIPTIMSQVIISYTQSLLPLYIGGAVGIFVLVVLAVWMNEAHRPVPVTYSRYGVSSTGQSQRVDTYIPVKVNPVGVISIIFSLTIVAFLQFLFRYLSNSDISIVSKIGTEVTELFAIGIYYAIPVFLLTMFFTYFHSSIVFNTKKIADNLQKQGAFIPGLRPGEETIKYFDSVLIKVIFYAAMFLSFVAAIPFAVTSSTTSTVLYAVGGTGLLIIVSVVIDIMTKVRNRLEV